MFIQSDEMTIQALVAINPETKNMLDAFGIDSAVTDPNTPADVVATPTLHEPGEVSQTRDWSRAGLRDLVDHVRSIHHEFLWKELPRLDELFKAVIAVHSEQHGELLESLYSAFKGARNVIEKHMLREERLVFPYIQRLEAYTGTGARPAFAYASIQHPIQQLEEDHQYGDMAIAEMRALTADYRLPEDACERFTALYDGLLKVEADIIVHIGLERDILFPKAIEREQA